MNVGRQNVPFGGLPNKGQIPAEEKPALIKSIGDLLKKK
jgi:hypothetical protein